MITLFVISCLLAGLVITVLTLCGVLIFPIIDVFIAAVLIWLALKLIELAKKILQKRKTE